jgi:hypothetical protein
MSHPQNGHQPGPLAAPSFLGFRRSSRLGVQHPTSSIHGLHGVRPGRVPAAQQREDVVEHLATPAELLSYVSYGVCPRCRR